MREKWIVIIAVVALGGVGYLYIKDRKAANAGEPGSIAASQVLSVQGPQPLADTSVGSYVDPNGGLNYIDAVPISISNPTGFTAADYNYGVTTERPIAQLPNGFDLVTNPNQSGFAEVPRGPLSLASYSNTVYGAPL